jgi:tRNA/tmRNA/rRNA uracil-C5-methylase (TrmA/RlmC/RlmD family)
MNKLSTIDCEHFGPCAGCTLNNPNSPLIWESVKEFFGDRRAKLSPLQIGSIIGWRIKAKLAVSGKTLIGLYRAGSHDVLPIPRCKIHHPSINQAVALIEKAVAQENISILRYIQCLVQVDTGKVQLTLVVQKQDPSIDRLCNRLQTMDLFHSLWLNIQPVATNTILGEHWVHRFGPEFLEQKLAGKSFLFHPGAFSQAHWTLFEQLALDVVDMIPSGAKLLEIYAGIGVMGILAAPKCTSVSLIENNPFAHKSFEAMEIGGISYHFGDAKLAIERIPDADCYLLDPPRKGVDPLVLAQLLRGTIIYVSCDFNSFVRDATTLIKAGWELKEGKGYLLFPGTNHVETVARFEKFDYN